MSSTQATPSFPRACGLDPTRTCCSPCHTDGTTAPTGQTGRSSRGPPALPTAGPAWQSKSEAGVQRASCIGHNGRCLRGGCELGCRRQWEGQSQGNTCQGGSLRGCCWQPQPPGSPAPPTAPGRQPPPRSQPAWGPGPAVGVRIQAEAGAADLKRTVGLRTSLPQNKQRPRATPAWRPLGRVLPTGPSVPRATLDPGQGAPWGALRSAKGEDVAN